MLDEQKQLGKRYEELSIKRSNKNKDLLSSLADEKIYEEELNKIQAKLRENTILLCRNLKETPNESNNWNKVQKERTELKVCKTALIRRLY